MLLRRLLTLLSFVFMITLIPAKSAYCRDFDKGYELYKKGKYKKAKKYLVRGMRKSKDKYDKALIYKIIGLIEYESGSKSKAKKLFSKALRLDPSLTISRNESSNRGAIALFKKTKRRTSGGSRPRRQSFRSSRRQRRSARASSRGRKSQGSLITNIAPLGIGQFAQGKTILGAGIAAGQAFGLFLYLERTSAADAADQDALNVIQQQEADSNTFSEDEFNNYINQNEAFVKDARQQAQTGLLIFFALYGAGVAEAFLNPPKAAPSRMRRRARMEVIKNKLAKNEILDSLYLSPHPSKKKGWDWSLSPSNQGLGLLSLSHNF